MIRSITQYKPDEELDRLLEGCTRVFIMGCGTCSTLTKTGGEEQVKSMAEVMIQKGKAVTGTFVAPVACDNQTTQSLEHYGKMIDLADAVIVMSCAYGVQNAARQLSTLVIPALDTLFMGKEEACGTFNEVCTQCGTCIIGETGGICPVTTCHKGLVNGPCGGTDNGKCEIDRNIDCAWTRIYNRLDEMEKLFLMKKYQEPRNHNRSPSPGNYSLSMDS